MEMMLFSMLLAAGVFLSLVEWKARRLRGAALAFILLSLTRPEGLFCFAACTAFLFVIEWRSSRSLSHLRRYLLNGGVYLAGFGSYFLWRFNYYGDLFPNTFHARVTGGTAQWLTGLIYLKQVFAAFPLLLLAMPLALLLLFSRLGGDRRSGRPALFIAATALSFLAYTVWVGGDFMPFYRFFLPVLPLACLLAAWSLCALPALDPLGGSFGRVAFTILFIASVVFGLSTEAPYRAFVAHRTAFVGRHVGAWFRTSLPPDSLIAVNTAGAVPYEAGLPAIDMLGLTDENIAQRPVFIISTGWAAHRRGWGEYVLDRRPRAIVWYNAAGSREPYYLSDHELADDPFFRFFYEPRFVSLPGETDARGSDRVVARFFGLPFGSHPGRRTASPDMGMTFQTMVKPLPLTTVYEAPVGLNYFEFAGRYQTLWLLRDTFKGRPGEFVDEVARRWGSEAPSDFDPEARRAVEAMCEEALGKIQGGDHAAARRILTAAAARNSEARSAVVYQYIANLAVITGDLFTAVGAQREALRLAPDNALHMSNLKNLLRVPFKEAQKAEVISERETREAAAGA
jgi:hypothetical protein